MYFRWKRAREREERKKREIEKKGRELEKEKMFVVAGDFCLLVRNCVDEDFFQKTVGSSR